MKASILMPKDEKLSDFLQTQNKKPFSYPNIGATQTELQKGYDNDESFIYLGDGEEVWNNAKKALTNWKHFPPSWTQIFPSTTPIEKAENVAVLFRLFGIWWINSARIVYTIDEKNKFGFAYGTLPGHLEKGEECFWIKRDKKGNVFYYIKAFSKPAYWFVRLAYPLARMYQKRFVRESMAIMKKLSNKKTENHAQSQY
jgi:uncharacterized protein (UPF0548 family)